MAVTHWDDVEAEVVQVGELRATWRALGPAAGAFRAGVTRIDVEPGGRSTPAHVHGDEEELFFVLRGSGLSWQDGRTYAIAEGDVLAHRIHEEAHTLVAGPDGLDVLAFGNASATDATWLPHAGVTRVGPHWIPSDVEHPYLAEEAAGPLPLPEAPEAERPPTIAALADVPYADVQRGDTNLRKRDLGRLLGTETTGMAHQRIAPGARGWPHHCHSAEEELLVVLGGEGELRLGEERIAVRRGHVVARPPGTGVAHSFRAGERGLELLSWGTRVPSDATWYPDSETVSLRGLGPVRFRVETVDFWAAGG